MASPADGLSAGGTPSRTPSRADDAAVAILQAVLDSEEDDVVRRAPGGGWMFTRPDHYRDLLAFAAACEIQAGRRDNVATLAREAARVASTSLGGGESRLAVTLGGGGSRTTSARAIIGFGPTVVDPAETIGL